MPHPALTQAWADKGLCLAPGPGLGPGLGPSRCTAEHKNKVFWRSTISYMLRMCSFPCILHFLLNFANIASPAEMTITMRTASRFCTKRRAVQPPSFLLKLSSSITTRITDPWPECQPKEPWPECHYASTVSSLFDHYLATACCR